MSGNPRQIAAMSTSRLPALFLGHGSPMNVITDGPARRSWQALGQALPRPRAIVVVSAHWETQGAIHLTAGPDPRTIHDFRGFPPELFAMQYPAPGSDELVDRIAGLLGEHAIHRDSQWGFDHGSWGVIQPMYPEANIPMVQISLNRSLTPDEHLAAAERMAVLREEGVLLVGSGNVIHNLMLWRQLNGATPEWAVVFQARIDTAMLAGDRAGLSAFAPDDRAAALAINSAEHYLPLLYTAGWRLPGDEAGLFNAEVEGALSMNSYLLGDTALLKALA